MMSNQTNWREVPLWVRVVVLVGLGFVTTAVLLVLIIIVGLLVLGARAVW